MSTSILHTIFSHWHVRRVIGLIAAVFILTEAIRLGDGLLGVLSFILLVQVVFNTGCFGRSGCGLPAQQKSEDTVPAEPEFTEVT